MNYFQSLHEYEQFIYALPKRYPMVVLATLVLVRRSARQATVRGEVYFANGYRLVLNERLNASTGDVRITNYGYEIWHNEEKLYWYDSQPHPNNPDLALNHPHHKHVPPDIKHNRIPAPELSFEQPNLPFLIAEVEQTLLNNS